MAADGFGDRIAVGSRDGGLTYAELLDAARGGAALLVERGAPRLVAVDTNSEAVPVGLFAAALAGIPYVPVNYRLADDKLRSILTQAAPALALVDPSVVPRLAGGVAGVETIDRSAFLASPSRAMTAAGGDGDDIAVLLFTSGTTGEPKAAVLRHRHLSGYILSTVD